MKLDKHDRVAIYDILAEGYENAWDAVDSISECFLDINDYREDERIAELEAENKRLRKVLEEIFAETYLPGYRDDPSIGIIRELVLEAK